MVALEVPDHLPAVLYVPARSGAGSSRPRPVLVATHGAGGAPESQCHFWSAFVGERGFVLCPRGRPTHPFLGEATPGYFYPSHPALGAEVQAAFDALVRSHGSEIDPARPLYAGFSQGASMGALVLPTMRARFARLALVEGGYGHYREWDLAAARRLKDNGGERVLLACGRYACVEDARSTQHLLRRGGLDAEILYVRDAGHTYLGPMQPALAKAFEWLVAGDPRWSLDGRKIDQPGAQ
jgi:predicted esterase